MGQPAWVSTQELLQLLFMIRSGYVPDIVVFIDGFNDVAVAYQSGRVNAHFRQEVIAARVEGRDVKGPNQHPLAGMLQGTNLFSLAAMLGLCGRTELEVVSRDSASLSRMAAHELASEVAELYGGNVEIASRMSDAWDFQCLFFLQPVILAGDKPLSEQEELIFAGEYGENPLIANPFYRETFVSAYAEFETRLSAREDFLSLTDAFDDMPQRVYTDDVGCHLNSEGNLRIARIVCGRILELQGATDAVSAERSISAD
jgi:hypothetical protein